MPNNRVLQLCRVASFVILTTSVTATMATSDDSVASDQYQVVRQLLDRGKDRDAFAALSNLANNGDLLAMYNIGVFHELGIGTEPNMRAAMSWYQRAAIGGQRDALYGIGLYLYKSDPPEFERAANYIELAAKSRHLEAMFLFGEMNYFGLGMPQNRSQAFQWWFPVAKNEDGHPAKQIVEIAIAQRRVGNMFARGIGVPRNETEAWKWYRKAADNGDTDSQFWLAVRLFDSTDPDNFDPEAAYFWVLLASASGQRKSISLRSRIESYLDPDTRKVVQDYLWECEKNSQSKLDCIG